MNLDILPWIGLGPLRFGMKPSEVRCAFKECHVYEEWMGGNLNDSLLYRGLILQFDKCDAYGPLEDSRFDGVKAKARKDIWLFGKRLASWTRNDLTSYVDEMKWIRQDGPEGDLDIVDLAVGFGFDAEGHINIIELGEPGIRIIAIPRFQLPSSRIKVKFEGRPLRKEHLCLRTNGRWEYMGDIGLQSGSGPFEGFFNPLDKGGRLHAEDVLVPIGDPPQVPTSTSPNADSGPVI